MRSVVVEERSGIWVWKLPPMEYFKVEVYDMGNKVGNEYEISIPKNEKRDDKKTLELIIEDLIREMGCCLREGKYILIIRPKDDKRKLFGFDKVEVVLFKQDKLMPTRKRVYILSLEPFGVGLFYSYILA